MVSQTIKVVYENGVFRPLTPPEPPIQEGAQMAVTLEPNLSPKEIIELAGSVFDGLTKEEIESIMPKRITSTHARA